MGAFFKKHPFIMVLIAVILILALILITNGQRSITPVENMIGTVVSPVASGVSSFTRNVGEWFRLVFGISDVQKENAELKQRILQLEAEAAALPELEKENERLKETAQYIEDNADYEQITAQVIAKNPGYWFDSFLINAGRSHGVQANMPVVTSQGLVGRITEVGSNWSKVKPIIDATSSVSGLVERTRDTVIVRGNLDVEEDNDILLTMHYLPYDHTLQPGDRILTSSLGGIFPKGLVIGEVIEVTRAQDTSSTEQTATVKPSVDFRNMEEVIVILQVWEEVSP